MIWYSEYKEIAKEFVKEIYDETSGDYKYKSKYFGTLYDRYTDAIRDTAKYLKYEHELDQLKKGFDD